MEGNQSERRGTASSGGLAVSRASPSDRCKELGNGIAILMHIEEKSLAAPSVGEKLVGVEVVMMKKKEEQKEEDDNKDGDDEEDQIDTREELDKDYYIRLAEMQALFDEKRAKIDFSGMTFVDYDDLLKAYTVPLGALHPRIRQPVPWAAKTKEKNAPTLFRFVVARRRKRRSTKKSPLSCEMCRFGPEATSNSSNA